MFTCNFLAAGPSIQIVETTLDFFPPIDGPAGIPASIAKSAYFFTTTALFQGVGTLIWIPFLNKYGRRPAYLLSYVLYLATTLWLAFDKNYGSFLAGRIILGFSAGAAEAFAPVTIADLFFLHERGAAMS
jgi:MFS family permease